MQPSIRIRMALLCASLCLPAVVGAEESSAGSAELPEVVVTATRTKIDAADVTNTVSVISGDTITARGDIAVSEALQGSPGVDITQFGSPGSATFASIRGAAPDQVLVMLDGVQVNTPTIGQYDFANLTTDDVDRVEVLRGGGGTLYGSEAIGGVINVLGRRGTGPLTLTVSGEGGRAATQREVLGLNGAYGPAGISGTVSYFGTDGFQPVNDSYENFSTVWRGDLDLLPTGTLRAFVRYTNTFKGLPNFNIVDGVLDPDASDRSDFVLTKGEWEQSLGEAFNYRASVAWWKNYERFTDTQNIEDADDGSEPDPEPTPVAAGRFNNQLIQADAQTDYAWREFSLTTVGLEFIERSADVFQLTTDEDDEGEQEQERDSFRANRSNVGVYLEEQIRFLDDALHGVGGVRYDHFDDFGGQVTWSGSGSYLVRASDTRLRLSYATGFRAPSFDELFEPTLGNPNLRAETSWEIDAGFAQAFLNGRLRFEPVYFYRQVRNLIEEIADQLPGPIAGVPESAAAFNTNARFQGVELIAHYDPWPWLQLGANYTYLDVGSSTGPLVNRPRNKGAFTATARRDDLVMPGDHFTAAVQVVAVGERASADPFSTPVPFQPEEIGGYGRTDLALSYRFGGVLAPLTATASVRNLFNRDYQESIGFPAPPAWFLIGLRYAVSLPQL
jgi:vitamin B12 transporter